MERKWMLESRWLRQLETSKDKMINMEKYESDSMMKNSVSASKAINSNQPSYYQNQGCKFQRKS